MSYIINRAKYLDLYSVLLSQVEIEKIKNKVYNSKSLNRFVEICFGNRQLPPADVFVKQLCQSREFIFVFNYNKITVGLIFLLDLWIERVNNHHNIVNDWQLEEKLAQLVRNASLLGSGK
jgi:hypothetical protein